MSTYGATRKRYSMSYYTHNTLERYSEICPTTTLQSQDLLMAACRLINRPNLIGIVLIWKPGSQIPRTQTGTTCAHITCNTCVAHDACTNIMLVKLELLSFNKILLSVLLSILSSQSHYNPPVLFFQTLRPLKHYCSS